MIIGEKTLKKGDKVTFKIPDNYPMRMECIRKINQLTGTIIEILNKKVACIEFDTLCRCMWGGSCDASDIELKYLENAQ
jgi:hypothetical protein